LRVMVTRQRPFLDRTVVAVAAPLIPNPRHSRLSVPEAIRGARRREGAEGGAIRGSAGAARTRASPVPPPSL
jgi:hypothetical protein